jgi:CRISPR system Cascade subunit CasD
MRWLVLRIRAPLAAFGAEAIDARGPTRDFPALSAITGLLANALGYERCENERLQALQDRLVFGARRDAENAALDGRAKPMARLTDFHTAQLGKADMGWTTRGAAEGRAGGSGTYDSPHIRRRDYLSDARLLVVLTLRDAALTPTLDDVAAALERPARPLFFGRKPCLPAAPLFAGFVEATTARRALEALPRDPLADLPQDGLARAVWPAAEGDDVDGDRTVEAVEARNWRTGLHGGVRRTVEGRVQPAEPAS